MLRFEKTRTHILLALMPFWTPMIPPLGISCLKSFLKANGWDALIRDFNTDYRFWNVRDTYSKILEECIPESKKGDIHTAVFDVLMYHSLLFVKDENDSVVRMRLLDEIVEKVFLTKVPLSVLSNLDAVFVEFYGLLDKVLDEVFKEFSPDIFGVSVFNSSLGPSLYAIKKFKIKYPQKVTVMGGGIFSDQLHQHSSNFGRMKTAMAGYIDKIIIGEGEIPLLELLENGISSDSKDVCIQGEALLDLNSAPPPDFDGLNLDAYLQLAAYGSRGCIFKCKFCSETFQFKKYKNKKPLKLVEELRYLQEKHNYNLFLLSDSLLNPIIDDLANNIQQSKLKLYFDGYLRISKDTQDISNIMKWREGGLYRARIGVESGSDEILKKMNKQITVEQIEKSLTNLARFGVKTTTYWIVGYPEESDLEFAKTLELLKRMKDNIYSADFHGYWFHPMGQVMAIGESNDRSVSPVFSNELVENIFLQKWCLKTGGISSERILDRLAQAKKVCHDLNIPNPYSYREWMDADMRWQGLHVSAVPGIFDIRKHGVRS